MREPPRVLHLITRLDAGGAATNTLISIEDLREHGFETSVVYGRTLDPEGVIRKRLDANGVNAISMPCLVRNVAPLKDTRAFFSILRLLRRERVDLLHTHSSKAGALGRMAAALVGVPVIHTPHGHIFYGYFGPLVTRCFILVERLLARGTRRIVSLTDAETGDALAHGIGRPGQYRTIPSGVPLDDFRSLPADSGAAFRAELGIPAEAPLVVSTGRLTAIKGFDLLIRAFAACRETSSHLAIVGGGEERAALESLARECNVADRVHLTGQRADVRPALSAAGVFALASRNEGMGRSLIEAMAAGLPVVAARVGGIPTFVQHERNGLLFESGDSAALADCIDRVLSDPALAATLAQQAAESVYPQFDRSTMVQRLADLYADVLRDTKGSNAGGEPA